MSDDTKLREIDIDETKEEYPDRWERAVEEDGRVRPLQDGVFEVKFENGENAHNCGLYRGGGVEYGFCDCEGFTFHDGACSHLCRLKMEYALNDKRLPPVADAALGIAVEDAPPEPSTPEPQVEDVRVEDAEPVQDVDLPDRSIQDDPIQWLKGENSAFVDTIDGTPAINRKGFEVLAHFYNIEVAVDVEIDPADTDFQYCRCKAETTDEWGHHQEAYGSAHVDRGDESYLLLEMAETRAKKRALSLATGVGAVAVEELKNEPEGATQ